MRREFALVVEGPDVNNIREQVGRCAATAAVVGAIAALTAAGKTFKACLATSVVFGDLRIENRGGWTDWGGC